MVRGMADILYVRASTQHNFFANYISLITRARVNSSTELSQYDNIKIFNINFINALHKRGHMHTYAKLLDQ